MTCPDLTSQGGRPVTLVGFSLGAYVVWECLHEMCRASEAGEARAAGIVQHAVLLGLPASSDPARWRRLRRVVAGRLVNCYRPDDLVLSLAHRAAQLKAFGVAGLGPVPAGAGVESYNVSRLVRLEAEYVFVYPNQRPRGHAFSRIRPYSAVFTVLFSVVFTRCSEHTAQNRLPALRLAFST